MYRHLVIFIISSLLLSACAGGVSGIMTSSVPGQWLLYKVTYPETARKFERSPDGRWDKLIFYEGIMDQLLLVNLGYKKKQDWQSPLLVKALAATFQQKYKGNYISIIVEISLDKIIIMSTSYSSNTKEAFDTLEFELKEIFGEGSFEECFGTKALYAFHCFGQI
ncbi:MAG: hypothetical protein DRQ48_05095 [Gammaproteobacteria bacterium]|nr:MAG: hypothetical protein DRQ58_11035 [Gammaproteobacteria bacterium]RKZ70942.1 MAG: hypothetical protein DRQ48_05095 [Gammaproteobacteria bacterium]